MKKIITCFFTVVFLSCGSAVAQTLEGTVIDGETNEPVHNALVYLDGTSFVTATDMKGKFKLSVKNTLYTDLIVSHISYKRVVVNNPFDELPEIIFLDEKVNLLGEVTISGKSIYTREQMLNAFRQQFLGTSRSGKACKILNEDDIILRYNTVDNILSASSSVPLEIENKYLGYKIRWEIVDFKIQYRKQTFGDIFILTVLMTGTTVFEDIEPDNKRIAERRKNIYDISSRHFFNLIANEKLSESNFSLFYRQTEYQANELFTVLTDINDSTIKHIKVKLDINEDLAVKQTISGHFYRNFQPHPPPLVNNSYIHFLIDTFDVDSYGNTNFVRNIMFGGEMGRQRVGNLLPFEYIPPSVTEEVEDDLSSSGEEDGSKVSPSGDGK
jgi:hypothetical protein